MRLTLLVIVLLTFVSFNSYAQLEISSGYAVNKLQADGLPISVGYDFNIKGSLYTKSQIGYKFLHYYNDFVEVNLNYSILELHQTFSYEVIKKKRYFFKPNIGINYRWYSLKSEILPPYNTLPQRAYVIFGRNGSYIRLNSFDGDGVKSGKSKMDNFGFTIQLQNQFKINKKLWLSITPFLEPDYDRTQNSGGCYVGVIFKQL